MKNMFKRNAAVTAAVFMLITAIAMFNRNDGLGVSAYALAAVQSRQVVRESLLRIEAKKNTEPANNVERMVRFLERNTTTLVETVSDVERLKRALAEALEPAYETACRISYLIYPEKIAWAYEAEQPEWVEETLRQNKNSYLANGMPTLNKDQGINYGPSGLETYYNFDMQIIIDHLQAMGIRGNYHVREDGVKMYGDYIMVAANYNIHPYGSFVETSLGEGIVCDTGGFAALNFFQLDIACDW